MKKADLLSGCAGVVFALAVCYGALGMPMGTIGNPGPGFLPFWVGAALTTLSLALITSAFFEGAPVEESVKPRLRRHVVGTLAGLVFYALALESLGYLVTTFLLLSMLVRMLGQRRWPLALAFSALATGGSYALFGLWLGAPLPRGLIPL